jgi:hypothetical protein
LAEPVREKSPLVSLAASITVAVDEFTAIGRKFKVEVVQRPPVDYRVFTYIRLNFFPARMSPLERVPGGTDEAMSERKGKQLLQPSKRPVISPAGGDDDVELKGSDRGDQLG